ncbi:hypothetical protein ACKGJN_10055 [Gillisia sp. Q332]|uniref:hypothetical protein n=1 Tax=Gillisia xinjiangensis TaxID=3384765 RepID=UPI00391D0AD4
MKIIHYISLLLLVIFTSCSSDSDEIMPVNEVADLVKIQTMENETHQVELYSSSGQLEQGYNKIFLRIKDKSDQKFVTNAHIDWKPVMHMETKQHSSPISEVTKTPATESLYQGFIVFQMAENPTEYWSLTLDYSVNGMNYTVTARITVPASQRRRVSVFTGTDGIKYILAIIDPATPKVATNEISMGVFKMENMMTFPLVNGYRVKIDPRMPSMGNHSSPNNVDLIQSPEDHLYYGKLNLTMTGYWKINLQLENDLGEIVKGESVTDSNEASTIFMELEF